VDINPLRCECQYRCTSHGASAPGPYRHIEHQVVGHLQHVRNTAEDRVVLAGQPPAWPGKAKGLAHLWTLHRAIEMDDEQSSEQKAQADPPGEENWGHGVGGPLTARESSNKGE